MLGYFLFIVVILIIILFIRTSKLSFIENRIQNVDSPGFSGRNENMRSSTSYAGGVYSGPSFLDTKNPTSLLKQGNKIYGTEFSGY